MNLLNAIRLEYYSPAHLSMLIFAPILILILYFSLRNKSHKSKTYVLLGLCILNALLYFTYKIRMAQTFDDFEILNELPLHLCNLNLVLMPIALLTNNKLLMSYFYYVGLLFAICGIMFFDSVFLGKSVFSYVTLVYFIYHSILISVPILLVLLKMFTPKLSEIWKALVLLFALATVMLVINLIFRLTGICEKANYFYTMGMDDNPVLGPLMKIIPVPLLYYLPTMPILYGFAVLISLPFLKKNKESELVYETIG